MSFILNTRSRTVHRRDSTDKRCQLKRLNPENALEFSAVDDALRYLSEPAAVKICPFCLAKHTERPEGDE